MADIRTFGAIPDGTTDCTAAIQAAVNAGNVEIQNGIFLYTGGVTIPSGRTITIKNAALKLADNSHNNFFRNSDFVNGNSNITIRGIGNAIFDGNAANNDDDYTTYGPVESVTIYRYQTIAFCKVDTFEISGINIVDYSHWNIVLQHCTNGTVDDVYINYFTKTVNQDAIDICHGCNNITISNIKGYAADDIIALWASNQGDAGVRVNGWNNGDIHDISIDNINIYNAVYHVIISLAGDGNKIYNIECNDWIVWSCFFFQYYGLSGYYDTAPAKTDVHDFIFDNITVLTQADTGALIRALEPCMNIAYTNFINSTGKADYSEGVGLDVENFTINGVQQSA